MRKMSGRYVDYSGRVTENSSGLSSMWLSLDVQRLLGTICARYRTDVSSQPSFVEGKKIKTLGATPNGSSGSQTKTRLTADCRQQRHSLSSLCQVFPVQTVRAVNIEESSRRTDLGAANGKPSGKPGFA